ncbi:MAG: hypothetical protein JRF41_02010 [Deltaproteobacteria bacterium]|nr:hypothetical protein [Deltaproteobacteria bacterium]
MSAGIKTGSKENASVDQVRPQTDPDSSTAKKKKIQSGSIQITTDRLEVDDNKKVVFLNGKVTIRWEDLVLTCDIARVFYREIRVTTKNQNSNPDSGSSPPASASKPAQKKDAEVHREILRLEAEGHVKVAMKNSVALAGKAVYETKSRLITFTDSPQVWRGKDVLSGDRITMYLDDGRSVIESGPEKKVKATFYQPPQKRDEPPAPKSETKEKQ